MLNIYVPDSEHRHTLIQTVEDILQQESSARDITFHEEVITDFQREKLLIANKIDNDLFEKISHAESASIIEENLYALPDYISMALSTQRSDIYLAITTRTAYKIDLITKLAKYLQTKEYSQGLVENFISVFQELKNNAIMHGNLEQNIKINSITECDQLSPEEKQEKLQHVFDQIKQALDSDKGDRAIVIRVVCHDETVLLEVQDQGKGFDFEAFKEKYKDTKLIKGMDMVFLMSKDMQYDPETRTMRAILEDPDSGTHKVLLSKEEDLVVSIWGQKNKEFSRISKELKKKGIKVTPINNGDFKERNSKISQSDAFIMLEGQSQEERTEALQSFRENYAKTDFPVFFQKPEQSGEHLIQQVGPYVNDFINYGIEPFELISRIKAHNSMYQTRKAFDGFYKHYHSEVMQSQNTIGALEKQEPITIRDKENKSIGTVLINGSHTVAETTDNIARLEERAQIPYGNGFSFSQRDSVYFIFISMRNGLSSILLLSYLEGCIEQIKNLDEPMTPKMLVSHFQNLINDVIPLSFYSGVFCAGWDKQQEKLSLYGSNQFAVHCYDSQLKKITSYNNYKDYKLEPDHYWMVMDASIRLAPHTLVAKMEEIANHHTTSIVPVYEPWMDIITPHGTRIPYLLLSSKKEEAK